MPVNLSTAQNLWPPGAPPLWDLGAELNPLHPLNRSLLGCWSPFASRGTWTLRDIWRRNGAALNGYSAGAFPIGPDADVGMSWLLARSSSQYAEAPDDPSIRPTAFTLSTWVKRGSTGTVQGIWSKHGNSGGWRTFLLQFTASNTILFTVENSTLNQFPSWITTSNLTNTSLWHHIAVTYKTTGSSSDCGLWLDGVAQSLTYSAGGYTSSFALQWSSDPWGFGVQENDSRTNFYDGWLGELRLYGTVLTDASIYSLYNPATRWTPYRSIRRRLYRGAAAAPASGPPRGSLALLGVGI